MLKEIQLANFKAFSGPETIPIRPLTLIFGPNSAGKSSILQFILLLKQTIELATPETTFLYKGDIVDLGSYRECVHKHNINSDIEFKILITLDSPLARMSLGRDTCGQDTLGRDICGRDIWGRDIMDYIFDPIGWFENDVREALLNLVEKNDQLGIAIKVSFNNRLKKSFVKEIDILNQEPRLKYFKKDVEKDMVLFLPEGDILPYGGNGEVVEKHTLQLRNFLPESINHAILHHLHWDDLIDEREMFALLCSEIIKCFLMNSLYLETVVKRGFPRLSFVR